MPDEIAAALAALDMEAQPIPARSWPGTLAGLELPGLYSWWTDGAGAADLSVGLSLGLAPGRIYAGQTGATKWPSGKVGRMSLRQRVGGNHLRGAIRGSTFRRTLAAVLRQRLGLSLQAPDRLAPESERALSAWIVEHLAVAVYPHAERDALASLEREVLAVLNPPLNLDGMPPTRLRMRLTALRAELSATTLA